MKNIIEIKGEINYKYKIYSWRYSLYTKKIRNKFHNSTN